MLQISASISIFIALALGPSTATANNACPLPTTEYLDTVSDASSAGTEPKLVKSLGCLHQLDGAGVATIGQAKILQGEARELTREILASTKRFARSRDKGLRCAALKTLVFYGDKASAKGVARCSFTSPEQLAVLLAMSGDTRKAKAIALLLKRAGRVRDREHRADVQRSIIGSLAALENRKSLKVLRRLLRRRQYEPIWDAVREAIDSIDVSNRRPGESMDQHLGRALGSLSGPPRAILGAAPSRDSKNVTTASRRKKVLELSSRVEDTGWAGRVGKQLRKAAAKEMRRRTGRSRMCLRHEVERAGAAPKEVTLRLQVDVNGKVASIEQTAGSVSEEFGRCLSTGLKGVRLSKRRLRRPDVVDWTLRAYYR